MQNAIIRLSLIFLIFCSLSALAQSTASPQISKFTIAAPQLQSVKEIWVYLPKSYTTSNKTYPVIYMHDAQNLFDKSTAYSGEWQVDEALDSISAQVIVIGIEHGGEKRIAELTPFANDKYGGGDADAYLQFIVETLKPQIDLKYRTKSGAKNTAMMGSSLGGLVSYYAAVKYPNVFGKVGVFSPSFWFSDKIFTRTAEANKIKTKIYLLAGDNEGAEMVPDLERMNALLSTKRCDCKKLTKKIIVKGGMHNEKLWRENFLNAYLWLF